MLSWKEWSLFQLHSFSPIFAGSPVQSMFYISYSISEGPPAWLLFIDCEMCEILLFTLNPSPSHDVQMLCALKNSGHAISSLGSQLLRTLMLNILSLISFKEMWRTCQILFLIKVQRFTPGLRAEGKGNLLTCTIIDLDLWIQLLVNYSPNKNQNAFWLKQQ